MIDTDVVIVLTDDEMREQWIETWVQQPKGGLRMPPETITSVLLPDGKWHEIAGSLSLYTTSIAFTEKQTGMRYCFDQGNVIAARGFRDRPQRVRALG